MAFLSDDALALRPVEAADLPMLARWRNDPEVRHRTRCYLPLTDADQDRWYRSITGPGRRHFMFVVEAPVSATDSTTGLLEAAQPIGCVGLCHWQPRDRSAEVSFYIGEPSARRHGYASRAVLLLFRYGFGELNLHRIWAEVYEFNQPGVALLERCGMQTDGRLRHAVWRKGGWCDSIMMSILEEAWRG